MEIESTWTMVDELDNIFTLSSWVKIAHLPEGLSSEIESLLVHLPTNQVCICPASLASKELLPKLPHLLRSAGPRQDQEVEFRTLFDTWCSVATTGFEQDFCGQLAYGRFGIIKTTNGMAEIKEFGMVHWETMDANGKMVLIKVPAYCVPTVEMRLLSPQDYTRYHEIDMPNAYAGNANFMQLQIATPEHQPGKLSSTVTVHANICMGSCLPFLSGSPYIPQPSKGFQPCK